MLSRGEIKNLLKDKKKKKKNKKQALTELVGEFVDSGEKIDKIGKLIGDIRSYPEWEWGE